MKFELLDQILDEGPDRLTAVKQVSRAEEYLGDHFPTFPVLPGVLMVETMVQAARRLIADRTGDDRYVLGEVKAFKFGGFVRPGESFEVEVALGEPTDDGAWPCKGTGVVRRRDDDAPAGGVSGRFIMRPLRDAARSTSEAE